jgi:hypothetical protein
VGVEVARGAPELGAERHHVRLEKLFLQTFDEDEDLLSQACGGRRLAVGSRQHGHLAPAIRHAAQPIEHLHQGRADHPMPGVAHHGRHGGVVDVLARKAEMDELPLRRQPQSFETLLEKVFHRLDIVVGDGLDLLNPPGVIDPEFFNDAPETGEMLGGDAFQRRQRDLAQGDEVLHFHPQSITDQGTLAEIVAQGERRAAVAPVDGGDGGQGSRFRSHLNILLGA